MTNFFSIENITEFQIEVTTHCNAACPQCPRNINGGETNPYLKVGHLDRSLIDKTFTPELCNKLKQIFFCGSYGDPIVHPEFLNIVKDFRKKSKRLWIYIHTNGGARNTGWWEELAEVIGDYGKIDFNIDGLGDTNYLYRRNVSFDKAMENAKAFIDSGGKAQWNFIVFKHNEHQVETAKMLSKLWGFENIVFRGTGRFLNHKTLEKSNQWKVTPKKGKEYYLKPTDIKKYSNQSIENLPKLKEEYSNIKEYFNKTPIKCDALNGKKVVITGEGLVLPCNFFEHNLYDARFKDRSIEPSANQLHYDKDGNNQVEQFIKKYDKKNLSIHYNSLEKIFKNPFWNDLVNSWSNDIDNGSLFECAFTCGQKLTKTWDQNKTVANTYRYYITGDNRGLGKALNEHFYGDGSSRSTGYDITNPEHIKLLAKESLHYDVFINNAFDGPPDEEWANFAQVNLLHAVYDEWKSNEKTGWIFNIGSIAEKNLVPAEPKWERYRVAKSALNYASKQSSAAFKNNLVNFKTTLITPDRLDTEFSRSKNSWTGNGIDCNDIAKFIEFCVSVSPNTVVDEISLSVNFNYQK